MNKKKWSIIKILILAAFVVSAVAFVKVYGTENISIENIREIVNSYGILAPIIFIGIYFIGTVIFFPGTALTVSSGVLFGSLMGTLFTLIGASLGSFVAFMISRFLGKDFVDRILKDKFKKLDEYSEKIETNGFPIMLFLRLVPLFPFNGLNFAMGLTRIKARDFFLGTVIGIIPGSFVLANIGASATDIRSPRFYISIASFLLLASIPYIYKKVKNKNKSEKPN